MPSLNRDGDAFVLDLGDDENRFNPSWMTAVSDLIDEAVAAPAPRALVTSATGKFWSNGLDLDWLGQNQDRVDEFIAQVHDLFAKMLAAPIPTVAAIQGHCFAAGAMYALAHDWRVMRSDRGYFCLPEADINIPFTPGMSALIQSKLTPAAATAAMVGAHRFGGEDALGAGIVDATGGEDSVVPDAIALAAPHAGKDGATLATIKSRMYAGALAALADRDGNRFG
jgi:enoyl-CoA hydratase/carnithine racemase